MPYTSVHTTTLGGLMIPVGTKVHLQGYDSADDSIGERVRAVPGEALDDISGDEPRVTIRWWNSDESRCLGRTREYVGSLVIA
jgi:hypothetical protein